MKKIKVSILCLTYNHGKYIKQTLDSFLMQKTDFNFEILINDDASSDGTVEILREYQKKHPGIIKPLFQKENQYSKGLRNFMPRFLFPISTGEYFALCEGDDYWTDPLKLQKQVDFLDTHNEYSLCFHPVKVVYENNERETSVFPERTTEFSVKKLLEDNFIQTNSVMYRKQKYEDMELDVVPGDWYLHLYHAQYGKIGFINEPMAVYRRHTEGIWHDAYVDRRAFWEKYAEGHLKLCTELLRMYGDKIDLKKVIYKRSVGFLNDIIVNDDKEKMTTSKRVVEKYPEFGALAVLYSRQVINTQEDEIQKLKGRISLLEKSRLVLEEQIQAIYNSRTFKLGIILLAPARKVRDFLSKKFVL